jgi:hypothetical protein
MGMHERVWAANYATELWLTETESPEGDPRLEVTADVGDQETTIVLDPDGVRQLRLLLARYERHLAALSRRGE